MKVLAGLAILSIGSAAGAEPQYSTLFVFGASNVDRGRTQELLVEQDPSFSGIPVSPPYFEGHFTNGPTYVERLPALLGFPPAPEQNFAVGGAGTGDTNSSDQSLFLRYGGTFELPGMAEQIDSFLETGAGISPDALVVVHGGSVDYKDYLELNPDPLPDQIALEVQQTVGKIEENVRRLAAAGAETFFVPNDAMVAIDFPTAPTFNELHRQAINTEMGGLAAELGVEIVVADFDTALDLLLTTPERFGFTNVSDPCLTSAAPTVPPYIAPGRVCSDPEQYLFWDDYHVSSATHRFLAEFAADTLTAPQTVAAQARIAAFAGDSFLRRMDAIAGTGGFAGRAGAALAGPGPGKPYELLLTTETTQGAGDFGGASLGFDYSIASLTGGIVFHAFDTASLGLLGGYDRGSADLDGWDGSVDLTSYRIGALAGHDGGRLFGAAGLAYGFDNYDLARQTYVPELTSTAGMDGGTLAAFGTAGYRFQVGPLGIGPLSGLRYTRVQVDDYDESGAPGLDMHVEAQAAESLIGSAGLLATMRFVVGGAQIVSHASLTLEGGLLEGRTLTTALVTVPDVDRHLEIEPADGGYGRFSGGLAVDWPAGLDLGLAVDWPAGLDLGLDGAATLGRPGGDEYSLLGRLSARF